MCFFLYFSSVVIISVLILRGFELPAFFGCAIFPYAFPGGGADDKLQTLSELDIDFHTYLYAFNGDDAQVPHIIWYLRVRECEGGKGGQVSPPVCCR